MYSLQDVLQFEEQQFEQAFHAYLDLYGQHPTDYQIWRHFYFFLWAALDQAPVELLERLGVTARLRALFTEGESRFTTLAEFQFLAGYTVAILPYEFGPFDEWEQKGKELLHQATVLDPTNLIYHLAYLGSLPSSTLPEYSPAYRQAVVDAAPLVATTFQGNGLLNQYFRQVLCRVDEL
ncbi:hypothetical protein [Hymenobacter canadensis]|uniref:Uncharacterized protein n=1 Tax=Hymenobacter canadensis TaxID=2999067 RepID=A0ABY7M082_9BACT|nr:hypothetical protein [Hymenobacter canadensis]WBA44385.1 hypothetical protein O3303_21780 [Hymenobacter canadensis]